MSPLSLTKLMVMLNAGGETAPEIQQLFKFRTESSFVIQNYTKIIESLQSQTANKTTGVELVTASRIIANSQNSNIHEDYIDEVSSLGKVETFSFAHPKSVVEKTNEWAKNRTRGKISKLVEETDFTDETAAVLLDAVYFKAPWKTPFNISLTKKDDFHISQRKRVQVDMMHISAEFPYADLSDVKAKAVFLLYKGDRMSMIIYLPWATSTLSALEEQLEILVPSKIRNKATTEEVLLSLPKFNISSSLDFQPVLTYLGVQKMFKRREADFRKMSNSAEFHVSKIRQKVFMEVNEEGGEAAVATGAAVSKTTAMKVDRPFLFQIFDEVTGGILLTGRITNPKELRIDRVEIKEAKRICKALIAPAMNTGVTNVGEISEIAKIDDSQLHVAEQLKGITKTIRNLQRTQCSKSKIH